MELKINKYITESEKAISILSQEHGVTVSTRKFQIVLAATMSIEQEDSHTVVFKELTADEMVAALKDYSFDILLLEITFENSILPDGIPKRLDEETIKSNGEIWRIHKNDQDPFPSNPHAHNLQSAYKLHLGSGMLYYKKAPVKAISKKHLEAIRGKCKNIELPPLEL